MLLIKLNKLKAVGTFINSNEVSLCSSNSIEVALTLCRENISGAATTC